VNKRENILKNAIIKSNNKKNHCL